MKKRFYQKPDQRKSLPKNTSRPEKRKNGDEKEPSSPVCYVEKEKFREGFEDLNKKS